MSIQWNGVMPAVFTWLKESKSGSLEIDFDITQKQAAGILKAQGKGGSRMSGLVGLELWVRIAT
ncbi:hypothetical protein FBALC1_02642 [Flavobacteriales bacterium ALC-1]|nr:hypothetical protein FBALC1_02642 [Flavobacteriales bacterium ALC-1]